MQCINPGRRTTMRGSGSNYTEDAGWTVVAYLDHWLHTTAANRRQPDTIDRYEDVLRQYLEPVLGPVRPEQFTVQDAQLLLASTSSTPNPSIPLA
jgi:hypothetical protein